MFLPYAKEIMLNSLTITHVSGHTAFPGAVGANELAGGGYVRAAPTFAVYSGGSRNLSAGVTLTIPTGSTVRWLNLWNGANSIGYAPNAGIPKEFFASTSTDVVTCPAHGYVDTNKIVFYGDTTPAGLTEGTVYFVRDATADTFKVAATAGGAAIDLTGTGGSGCVVSSITEETYGGGGSHLIANWALGLPN